MRHEVDTLLHAMDIAAYESARQRLSELGREMLDMLKHATINWEMPIDEVWELAEGIEDLDERDIRILEIYAARASLIEHFWKGVSGKDA